MFSELCCEAQSMKYLLYGHLRRKMNPEDYMEKLMEYWDEDNKPLNFITVIEFLSFTYPLSRALIPCHIETQKN